MGRKTKPERKHHTQEEKGGPRVGGRERGKEVRGHAGGKVSSSETHVKQPSG